MNSFSEEQGFILCDTEKEIKFPPGFEPSIYGLWGELSTTELRSDLLMNGHESNVYQVPNCLFTNQSSVRNCHKMINGEQFQTKCCANISAALTLTSTDVFLIKNVTKLQQKGILSVLKRKIFVGKWVEILWRQVIIIENLRSL